MNDCNIENAQTKESIIWNLIVTGANCETTYRQYVEAGPSVKLDKVLEFYRNEATLQACFFSRYNSQPTLHQMTTD